MKPKMVAVPFASGELSDLLRGKSSLAPTYRNPPAKTASAPTSQLFDMLTNAAQISPTLGAAEFAISQPRARFVLAPSAIEMMTLFAPSTKSWASTPIRTSHPASLETCSASPIASPSIALCTVNKAGARCPRRSGRSCVSSAETRSKIRYPANPSATVVITANGFTVAPDNCRASGTSSRSATEMITPLPKAVRRATLPFRRRAIAPPTKVAAAAKMPATTRVMMLGVVIGF